MSSVNDFALLAGRSGQKMAERISASLERLCRMRQEELSKINGGALKSSEEREMDFIGHVLRDGWHKVGAVDFTDYPDGEIKPRLHRDTNVRGRDVYIVQNPIDHGPERSVNDNILETFFLIDAVIRSEADSITLVLPYFCYCRQDKSKGKEPVSAEVIARLFQKVGVRRLVTFDLHADQESAYSDPTKMKIENLFSAPVLLEEIVKYFNDGTLSRASTKVTSPDLGRSGMADHYAKLLELEVTGCKKKRSLIEKDKFEMTFDGEVEGCDIIMPDDQVQTAGTVYESAKILRAHGARRVYVAAPHGLLVGPAEQRLTELKRDGLIEEVMITDSIPQTKEFLEQNKDFIRVVSLAGFLTRAIYQIHTLGSISGLYEARLREGYFP